MAINMKDCLVLKDKDGTPTGRIVSPKVLMLYPALFEPSLPKGETDKEEARYGATFLFHKTADLTPMTNRVNDILKEKLGAKLKETKVKRPFLKVTQDDEPKLWARLEAAGLDPNDWTVMVRSFSKIKPTVKSPVMTDVIDETEVYEGRFVRFSTNLYWYDVTTNKGVSAGLNNVQLLDHSEVIPRGSGGGNANDEFTVVEGIAEGESADSMFG